MQFWCFWPRVWVMSLIFLRAFEHDLDPCMCARLCKPSRSQWYGTPESRYFAGLVCWFNIRLRSAVRNGTNPSRSDPRRSNAPPYLRR